jgi:hypothetical protein
MMAPDGASPPRHVDRLDRWLDDKQRQIERLPSSSADKPLFTTDFVQERGRKRCRQWKSGGRAPGAGLDDTRAS